MSKYSVDSTGLMNVSEFPDHVLLKFNYDNFNWSERTSTSYIGTTFSQPSNTTGASVTIPLCFKSIYFPYHYRTNEYGAIEKNIPAGIIDSSHCYLVVKDKYHVSIVTDLKGFMKDVHIGANIYPSINPEKIKDDDLVVIVFEPISIKLFIYVGKMGVLRQKKVPLTKGVILCYGSNAGALVKSSKGNLRTYGTPNSNTNLIITPHLDSTCEHPHYCQPFDDVSDDMFYLVNNFFRDLKTFSNYVLNNSSLSNINFKTETENLKKIVVIEQDKTETPRHKLDMLTKPGTLFDTVKRIKSELKKLVVSADQYLLNVKNMELFATGDNSPTILVKIDRLIDNNMTEIIAKITPLQLKYQEKLLGVTDYQTYVEAPLNAIFLKEAWMYCFAQNVLSKYVPTFACIRGSFITTSLPLGSVDNINKMLNAYESKKGTIAPKVWFSNLVDRFPLEGTSKEEIINSEYGIFEMEKISGVMSHLIQQKSFTLALFFEYLISKVVAAKVGKVIFADDHFQNVAYTKLDNLTTRCYTILQSGVEYKFYVQSDKMIKFIDLERYVFNVAQQEYYALSPMTEELSETKLVKNEDKITVEHLSTDKFLIDKMFVNLKNGVYLVPNEHHKLQGFLNDPRLGIIDQFGAHAAMYFDDLMIPKGIIDQSFYKEYIINFDTIGSYWEVSQ